MVIVHIYYILCQMNMIDATNRHTPSRLQKEMRKILISVRKDYVKKLLVHHQNYL